MSAAAPPPRAGAVGAAPGARAGRIALGAWRLARVVVHVLRGALVCAVLFPFAGAAGRRRHVGRWSARLLEVLGIALEAHGAPRPGAVLVAANHVSWLDILAVDAVRPVRFVAKSDVRRWPLLGWLVACGGTLFIERERKRDALRVVHQVADALRAGDAVAVFPEGTTSAGDTLLPFHANLLQAAIATATPVQPVALRYRDAAGEPSMAAPYVGDTPLVASLWTIATARDLRVRIEWLPPLASAHAERRALAERVRDEILAALGPPRPP